MIAGRIAEGEEATLVGKTVPVELCKNVSTINSSMKTQARLHVLGSSPIRNPIHGSIC